MHRFYLFLNILFIYLFIYCVKILVIESGDVIGD